MRSKDRLAELLHAAGDAAGVYRATVEPHEPALHDARVHDIFLEVERMRGWIHELDSHTQLMQRLHADPTFHTNKHLQEQLDAAVTAATAAGLKLSGALRQFETRLSARNDVAARIARLQYACTRRLYAAALARHHAALAAVRDQQRQLLLHQLDLTSLAVSEEECEALLESRDLALFVHNVRAETAEARRALRDVEARHEELARLEAALADVRDLFAQLAHLVAEQQDQVDSVEYYALQASEHVGSGGTQLLKGTVSRTRARKKKLSLLVCVAAGFAVVLLVLVLT
ncbi:syntaxin-1A-like isoform X5 [Helicoverpa zea]|uniref:syntaxin-1A-like isoform X5 n=1 Tax=Helicoverpa zea TaxID=7113 RepID=UPI001F561FD5|nr:syntaxin-1A-like isoform X5 [Helicoverpa zea]